jgi:protein involved in polysaccharide export with SLBB domain
MKALTYSGLFLTLALLVPGAVLAQVPPGWDATEFQISRQELQELLDRYESVLNSPGYSSDLKSEARRSADLIRSRLEEGDFLAGDRIILRLAGEPDILPDTVLVERGSVITLPNIGQISVYGILRSELQDYLTAEIGRFIRNPELTAQSLVRLSVQGSVGAPGFYVFPAEMLLADVLMAAGGPGQSSKLDAISIRRGEETLMRGGEVQMALDEGRSLDQLGLRAGDELNVPLRATSNWRGTLLRWGAIIISTTFLGIRIF